MAKKWAHIERARRILAREQGTVFKDWGGRLPIALVYPNTYRVGMSSLGFHTIYRLLNARADVVCERAFWQPRFADDDLVVSVESQQSIADFGVIAFSVSFEMDYTNLVQVLLQAGIPLRAADRGEEWPLVIVGGAAVSANPLPIADFVDAAVMGEAEEMIDPLTNLLWDKSSEPRDALWQALARLPGVYVPNLEPASPAAVQRQWVRNLDGYATSTVIHTPDTEFGAVHLIEIARGCGRGCRFCMAGFTTRPKREHSVASILEQARQGLAWRDRIGLVGAAVSDYSQIDALVAQLTDIGAHLSVSSLRVDPLSEPLLQSLAQSGTETLTLAPEAGSERLRQIINKGVTEADLVHAAERAAYHRFRQLKLYFMLGLPTETQEDVDEISRLCEAVAARFPRQVTASVAPFVPKAHTPFQWAAMMSLDELEARMDILEQRLRRQGIVVRAESPKWSVLQGMLARGDRQLGPMLAAVGGNSLQSWYRAMEEYGVDAGAYVRARSPTEPLPWSFIQTGVSAEYLQQEWKRAQEGAFTDPCPLAAACTRCGTCQDSSAQTVG